MSLDSVVADIKKRRAKGRRPKSIASRESEKMNRYYGSVNRNIRKALSPKREEKYEGWTNHATWLVALTFDNDEPLYRKRLAASGGDPGRGFTAASVKTFVKRARPGAYPKVNWKELAEHWSSS